MAHPDLVPNTPLRQASRCALPHPDRAPAAPIHRASWCAPVAPRPRPGWAPPSRICPHKDTRGRDFNGQSPIAPGIQTEVKLVAERKKVVKFRIMFLIPNP